MDQHKMISPFLTAEQMTFFFHKLLDASDLSLKSSCTQCFDCLPGSWWEAILKENEQQLQFNLLMCSRALTCLGIFLCQNGERAPRLSRWHRGSGVNVYLPLWLQIYYFGAFLLTSVLYFLSNLAFECPTWWTL